MIRPLGPTWQEVRTEIGARQQDVAKAVGLKGGQSAISNREADPDTTTLAATTLALTLHTAAWRGSRRT